MATQDHHPTEVLVRSHTPLVTYAVRAVALRLPDPSGADALLSAGLESLRAAADVYTAEGHDPAGFAGFAKRRINAALGEAVAGRTPTASVAVPTDLRSHMESISDDTALLAAAHPAAFAVPSPGTRRQAGHYAAVAAASDFRSHLDSEAAQQPNAAQLRAFGT